MILKLKKSENSLRRLLQFKKVERETFFGILVLNCQMNFFVVMLVLALVASGCTTRTKSRAQAQSAFLEGQNALLRQQQQRAGVTIIGPVQNPQVPWVAGLTLAQAIATANYLDSGAPKEIIITRNGESATLDPNVLLNGAVVPLEAGDVVELRQ
jgi:uncharacterized membrane protein